MTSKTTAYVGPRRTSSPAVTWAELDPVELLNRVQASLAGKCQSATSDRHSFMPVMIAAQNALLVACMTKLAQLGHPITQEDFKLPTVGNFPLPWCDDEDDTP